MAIEKDILPIKCCSQEPIFWKCTHTGADYCGCDVEKIECSVCGRIVYGAGSEEIKAWNNGENDE